METTSTTNMAENSDALLPEHWLDSQRLMVGLTLALVQEPGSAAAAAFIDQALGYIRPPPGAPNPELEAEYLKRLETIHPATLKRLTDLSPTLLPAEWASHVPYWIRAHLRLQNDGERFPLVGARLIADRIVNSRHTPAQIQQLGAAELSPDWHDFFPCDELEWVLKSARASNRDPHDVLAALTSFRRAGRPSRWEIVENALFQKLFIWPLLILETEKTTLEFSLPALLQTTTTEHQLAAIVGAGPLDAAQWEVSVRRATYAAKRLWQNKHKAAPPWLRDSVEQLSASVDLVHAAQIVGPFGVKLGLTGDSAETYFALAILGSLIDPTAIENVCATGAIGDEKEDPEGGGDHKLHEPGYVKRKFLYARDSYFFDTFLSPKPSSGVKSEKHLYVPREAMKRHHDAKHTYFSHFCDHVFEQKWRKQQYVRAPDLAEAFRPSDREERKSRLRLSDPHVEDVLDRLKANDDSALRIDDIPSEKVAAALYSVNSAVSWERVGSYAFLRAVPDAINDRMWWPIWDLISGTDDSFDEFRFAASSQLAAVILAREMNKVHPHEADPRRAPDILVVNYTDPGLHFSSESSIPGSPFERLRIEPMIEAINSLTGKSAIRRSPVPGLHEHIGHTRMIFVQDSARAKGLTQGNRLDFPPDEEARNALNRLSVFRYGFKREHARHVLGMTEDECDQTLASLCRPTSGLVSPLIFAEGAGEYFLTRSVDGTFDPIELAECHFEAANAITGLLAPREGAFRTNLRDAFSPRWVQEAQWHLQQAQGLIQRLDPNRLGEFRQAQQRLSRLAEPFGWTNVRWIMRPMRDRRLTKRKPLPEADFLSNAIKLHFARLEGKATGKNRFWRETHPTEYILAARYFSELSAQNGIAPARRAEFVEARDYYLQKGWVRAAKDLSMSDSEIKSCLFIHATASYCMLLLESPDEFGLSRSEQFVDKIKDLKDYQYCLDRSDRDLFEYLGDRSEDPYQSLEWYRLGIFNPKIYWMRPWPSLAFKYIGAAKVAGVSPSEETKAALDRLWKNSDPKKGTIPLGGLHRLDRVRKLWSIGRAAIRQGEYNFGSYSI